jgi:hypothetical protein
MAGVLLAKHPSLRFSQAFRFHFRRVVNLFLQLREIVDPMPPREINEIEALACQIASHYEWSPNVLLDRLYMGILDYFYYDGVIRGLVTSQKTVQRLRSAHVERYLKSTLKSFSEEAGKLSIVPFYPMSTIARASRSK